MRRMTDKIILPLLEENNKKNEENKKMNNQANKDYNNGMNILSAINYRIELEEHIHPLIYCNKIVFNNEDNQFWICGTCCQNYNIYIPSFLCTKCDYHLCQKCFISKKVSDINLVFPNEIGNICQNHNLISIKITNNYNLFCYNCKNGIYDSCKYCSICNFTLCPNCIGN